MRPDNAVELSGYSDDLIELNGAISEEFSHYGRGEDDEGKIVAFSDGTCTRIRYTREGVWRITIVAKGTAETVLEQAPEGDDDEYTDRLTLVGDIAWAVIGDAVALRSKS